MALFSFSVRIFLQFLVLDIRAVCSIPILVSSAVTQNQFPVLFSDKEHSILCVTKRSSELLVFVVLKYFVSLFLSVIILYLDIIQPVISQLLLVSKWLLPCWTMRWLFSFGFCAPLVLPASHTLGSVWCGADC